MGMLRKLGAVPTEDLVFVGVLAIVLLPGRFSLLADPGTYWHERLGREIAATGSVPRVDALTSTHRGEEWVDQSWLFDLALAEVVRVAGWPAAVSLTGVALAWIYSSLARELRMRGNTPLVAALVTTVVAKLGSIHFLVRPHVATFALVLVTLRLCRRHHERGGWSIAAVPALMIVWANVHGGFLAGPLIVATAAVGHAASGPWDSGRRRRLAGFAAAFAASCVAPLINPYGVELYAHVYKLLVGSRVTDLIAEYQPAPFGQTMAMPLEWIILGLIALPALGRGRIARYDLAHVLAWLHLGLGSIRHAPLFALAAAPALADLLDAAWGHPPEPRTSRGGGPGWKVAATALALGAATWPGFLGFSPKFWPLDALPAVNRLPAEARLFHEQDWGGMIESACEPGRAAFLDDRFELFGRRFIQDYGDALAGGPAWDDLDAIRSFEAAWLRPDRPLAKRLARDPAWREAYRDEVSVLFRREREPDRGVVATAPAPR